ncbi:bolA-like protein [Colletotrichum higginsianum]|nr:bolA-like protein [Colletotrichum higginsianum]
MLCRSCRRAIASFRREPPDRNQKLLLSTCRYPRSSPSSVFVYRPSLHITQTAPTRSYSAETSPSTPSIEKPDHLDAAESTIWDKLVAEFAPSELFVQDVSGGCGSMYAIDITSTKFKGANMLKQQRMVNAVLGDMLKQWHGVQLRTKAP